MKYYYYTDQELLYKSQYERFEGHANLSEFQQETKIEGRNEIFCYSIDIEGNLTDIENDKLNFVFEKIIYTDFNTIFENLCSVIKYEESLITTLEWACKSANVALRLENLYYKILINGMNENVKELYDILHDSTYNNYYYDINCEGYLYYKAMEYLRDNFESMAEIKNNYNKKI